jgi:hypothetical protein
LNVFVITTCTPAHWGQRPCAPRACVLAHLAPGMRACIRKPRRARWTTCCESAVIGGSHDRGLLITASAIAAVASPPWCDDGN